MIRCNLLNAVWISSPELCMITSLGVSFFSFYWRSCVVGVVVITAVYNSGEAPYC